MKSPIRTGVPPFLDRDVQFFMEFSTLAHEKFLVSTLEYMRQKKTARLTEKSKTSK